MVYGTGARCTLRGDFRFCLMSNKDGSYIAYISKKINKKYRYDKKQKYKYYYIIVIGVIILYYVLYCILLIN